MADRRNAKLKAADIMTEDPMTADLDSKVEDAIRILQTLEIRHLPVLNARGELVGMVSDRDLRDVTRAYLLADDVEEASSEQSALEEPITKVMSTDVLTIGPATPIEEVIDLMLSTKVGALPVVDQKTRDLVGIVSYIDVLRELADALR